MRTHIRLTAVAFMTRYGVVETAPVLVRVADIRSACNMCDSPHLTAATDDRCKSDVRIDHSDGTVSNVFVTETLATIEALIAG